MEKKIQLGENAAQKKAQNKDMLGGRFFKPDSEQCRNRLDESRDFQEDHTPHEYLV